MNEQLRALQQQVAQLQREVDELRNQQHAGNASTSTRTSDRESK